MKARLGTIFTLLVLVGGSGGALAIAGSSGSGGSNSAANGQYNPGKHCGKGQNNTPGKDCPKPMKVHGSARSAKAGHRNCFTFTVTSKGHRVKGAKVKLHGHTASTNRNGRATLCQKLHPGTYYARASKRGYAHAKFRIRITGARRRAG